MFTIGNPHDEGCLFAFMPHPYLYELLIFLIIVQKRSKSFGSFRKILVTLHIDFECA